MGDYDETPDLKPLLVAHGQMVANGVNPIDAATITRGLYAPVMSHGHMQRWLQVAWPIQQPPPPTPQQHAAGSAVAALVGRTGAPPQQAAQQMTQLFADRPYQPPPQRLAPTPVSELHHYGAMRQASPEPSDDVLRKLGDFQKSEYPNGVPSSLMGNRAGLKRAIADWSDRQDADASNALTGNAPGTRDPQLPSEDYPDSSQEQDDNAASALTGHAPGVGLDPKTQDADAKLAIGGY